jgi:hypothetical protein
VTAAGGDGHAVRDLARPQQGFQRRDYRR